MRAGTEETQLALALDRVAEQALTLYREDVPGPESQPSPPIGDAAYLRRASLVLLGRNPTAAEATAFLAKPDRAALIQQLVDSPEFARQEFRGWIARLGLAPDPAAPAQAWLLSALEKKLRYPAWSAQWIEKWTPELAADGERGVKWLEAFVGKNLDCARCHDHPYTDTTIGGLHGLLAFLGDRGAITMFEVPQPPGQIVTATTGKLEPLLEFYSSKRDRAILNSGAEWPDVDSAAAFSRWLHDAKNPLGRYRSVDRVWERMLGYEWFTALDEQLAVDQMKPNQETLLAAAMKIYESLQRDDRRFAQVIANSRLFGLGTAEGKWESAGLLGPKPRRLNVDQVERTIALLETGSAESPIAMALDSSVPPGTPVWERTAQLESRLFKPGAAWKKDLESAPTDEAKIDQLYLAVLSRRPTAEENLGLRNAIGAGAERFETALWALLMSEEFAWMP